MHGNALYIAKESINIVYYETLILFWRRFMALWVFLVLLVVGIITGLITRKLSKRMSGFGAIGDGIIGGAGGILGGYLVALSMKESSLGGLALTVASAIACAVLTVFVVKFITKP